VVHARTLRDTTFTFIVSGKLWRSNLIMQDKETGSLWSHLTGEALDGPMRGSRLEMLPAVQTDWAGWVREHPATKVLRKEREVLRSQYERYLKDAERIGMFRTRWLMDRMPGKQTVHGIVRGPYSLAIDDRKLGRRAILNVTLGDDPLVVVRTSDGGARAYVSRVTGYVLEFHRATWAPLIKDTQTSSTWDLDRGICIAGDLLGTSLEEVVVIPAFWFAWSSFFPETGVLD
jgi:hypothetical protein